MTRLWLLLPRLVLAFVVGFAIYNAYWLGRREQCRRAWNRGEVTYGEFCDCMSGAPRWIVRSTSAEVEELARRLKR